MRLIQYRKGEDAPEIRKKIAELEAAVWPESGEEAFPAAPETCKTTEISIVVSRQVR